MTMNNKIKELAERVGFHFYDMHDVDGQDLGETIESDSWAAAEKLVELVVRECIIQCEREWIRHGSNSVHNQAIHGCINSIKKHFGVEK